MDSILEEKINDSIWVAHKLFNKNKATGSVANLSFIHNEKIYITASGASFGRLEKNDFSIIDAKGNIYNELKPSKEYPLHLSIFKKYKYKGAVIHTHSTYSVLWSCLPRLNKNDCIPEHTPYLQMQLGKVGL